MSLPDVQEIAERLETETATLQTISRLCSGCMDQGVMNIPDFAYLLEPIIERQQELADLLHEIGFSQRRNTENMCPLRFKPGGVVWSKRDDETRRVGE